MLESGWLFVGRIAFGWTVLATVAAVYLDGADGRADGVVSNAGVVGFLLWGVWTFGALNIEVVDGGTTITFTHPELAIAGVAMALIPGYLALTGPIELIQRAHDPSEREL